MVWEALGDAIESQHGQESRSRAEGEAFSHVVRSVLDSAVPYHPRKGNLFLPGGICLCRRTGCRGRR